MSDAKVVGPLVGDTVVTLRATGGADVVGPLELNALHELVPVPGILRRNGERAFGKGEAFNVQAVLWLQGRQKNRRSKTDQDIDLCAFAFGRFGGTGQSADGRTRFRLAPHLVAFDVCGDGGELSAKTF